MYFNQIIILLHVVLYITDSLPFRHIAFSILCHVVYLQNFSSSWPLISLTSTSFLASCVLVISDHFLWFFYFSRATQQARRTRGYSVASANVPGFTEIASFFGICVWLAPLFLFLSLSANDHSLPLSAGKHLIQLSSVTSNKYTADSGSSAIQMQAGQQRVSLFRSLFSDLLPGSRKSQRDSTEGLLAPQSQPSSVPSSPTIPSPVPRDTDSRSMTTRESGLAPLRDVWVLCSEKRMHQGWRGDNLVTVV
jgi:hypothetical protein